MEELMQPQPKRRPRFRRVPDPPPFRLTDGDMAILRAVARHRFLRSTHIAALVDRSLDRVNDRLARLFHAGHLDRPRAQLDFYPTAGSAPLVYTLGHDGARLLADQGNPGVPRRTWSRNNTETGRPFIEHQLGIVDFHVALELATRNRSDVRLIHSEEIVAELPAPTQTMRNPLAMRVKVTRNGTTHDIGIVPDLVFGLRFADGSRRCFLAEIDRGTMPVTRADYRQTSVARKMHAYLAAHAAGLHERHFGWKTFRVLVITTDLKRMQLMIGALRSIVPARGLGAGLFFFAMQDQIAADTPLGTHWIDGNGRGVNLL